MSSFTPPAQQEREQEQIIGSVTGIVQKGPDRWQIATMPDGAQYPKNLWTKDVQVVQFCTSQIGNRLAFLCNVSHWTNQSGQPVRSLWIEQVGPPSVQSPALQGPAQGATTPPAPQTLTPRATYTQTTPETTYAQPQAEGDRQGKIHRQTATKVAAILLGYLPPEERRLDVLLTISERLVAYYDTGISHAESLDELMHRAMPASMEPNSQVGSVYGEQPPPHGDEDIPY